MRLAHLSSALQLNLHHVAAIPLACVLGWINPAYAQDSARAPATGTAASNQAQSATANATATTTTTTTTKGLFWEIKSGDKTVYMFGSIHLAKPDFYPLPKAVEAAYQRAEVLAVELDASAPGFQQKQAQHFTYAPPDKLQNHLSAATWEQLVDLIGPEAEALQTLKPMPVANALSLGMWQKLGYEGRLGIDYHFIKQAKADAKQIQEFETAEFMGQVLTSLSDADNDALLSSTLSAMKNGELLQPFHDMLQAWRNGDAKALAKTLREMSSRDPGSEKMMKALLDDRNILMAEKIIQLLQSGKPAFIVVGAGHMAGPKSIVDLLQKKGIQVSQIK